MELSKMIRQNFTFKLTMEQNQPSHSDTMVPHSYSDELVLYNPSLETFATEILFRRQHGLRSVIIISDTQTPDWLPGLRTIAESAAGLETLAISGITFVDSTTSASKLLSNLGRFLSVSV